MHPFTANAYAADPFAPAVYADDAAAAFAAPGGFAPLPAPAFPHLYPPGTIGTFGASPPAAGTDAAAAAGLLLGSFLGPGVGAALNSPQVQAQLATVNAGVQQAAKQGVIDAVKEYWYLIPLGIVAFGAVNYSMLVLGVIPLVRPRR